MYNKYPTGKRGAAHETQFTRHVNPYLQRSDVLIILELLFIAAEGVSSQPCRVQTFRTVSIHTSHSCWARQTCNLRFPVPCWLFNMFPADKFSKKATRE